MLSAHRLNSAVTSWILPSFFFCLFSPIYIRMNSLAVDIGINSNETSVWCHWKCYFHRIGRKSPALRIASEPTREMGFSEADNKGVSVLNVPCIYHPTATLRLCLHKHNLCQLSSQSDRLLKECRFMQMRLLLGLRWWNRGNGRGMRLNRAVGSGGTFSTHNALWCLFTHCGGLWVVRGKASHLLSLFCKAFRGHCGVSRWWHPHVYRQHIFESVVQTHELNCCFCRHFQNVLFFFFSFYLLAKTWFNSTSKYS